MSQAPPPPPGEEHAVPPTEHAGAEPGPAAAYPVAYPPAYPAQPGPQGPAPAQPYGGRPGMSPADERQWAMLAHLGGLVLGLIAALIVYLVYKDRGPFVRRHSAEALNFQLSLLIYSVVAVVVVFVITIATVGLGALVAIPLLIAAWVGAYILMIIAAVTANRGQEYRYPLTIRFVS